MFRTLTPLLTLSLLLCGAAFAAENSPGRDNAPDGNIGDLAWMTGSWSGPIGDGTLEENWITPANGSMGALVRITGAGTTSMIELIVIEQAGETLTLSIQQWNPAMEPRSPKPQKMALVETGDQMVSFQATEAGGLKGLTYSRPADDTFVVEVLTGDDREIQINLKAR